MFYDLSRKDSLMQILNDMIHCKKHPRYERKKLIPIIDTSCVASILAWVSLRNVLYDYGEKFFRRVTFLQTHYFIVYIIATVIGMLNYLRILNLWNNNVIDALLVGEIGFYVLILLRTLITSARVNDWFSVHYHSLFAIKKTFRTLLILKEKYANMEITKLSSNNRMHKHLYFLKSHAQEWKCTLPEYLERVGDACSEAITELEFCSHEHPVRLMGVRADKAFLWQIVTVVISLAAYLIENYLNS